MRKKRIPGYYWVRDTQTGYTQIMEWRGVFNGIDPCDGCWYCTGWDDSLSQHAETFYQVGPRCIEPPVDCNCWQ